MDEITKYLSSLPDLLSDEEQAKLLKFYEETRDEAARELLILHNLKLSAHIVLTQFRNTTLELEDLIQIASFGLVDAVENFRSDVGAKFSTFATICIKNAIFRSLKAEERRFVPDMSIDQQIAFDSVEGEGSEYTLKDVLIDEDESKIAEDFAKQDFIKRVLETFDQREQDVVFAHHGIGCKRQGQDEIAQKMGIAKSRVSQIETRAINKVRNKYKREVKQFGL